MSLYLRIIQSSDLDEILSFEKNKLSESVPDEMERELQSWNSRWRREALEHYLPLGWCFLARDRSQASPFSSEGQLVGYFLGQPLLFFHGQTQSLWVEHVQYDSKEVRDQLCELAYKLSREKHFQKVYFPDSPDIQSAVSNLKAQSWDPQVLTIPTTRASK